MNFTKMAEEWLRDHERTLKTLVALLRDVHAKARREAIEECVTFVKAERALYEGCDPINPCVVLACAAENLAHKVKP